jgi:hypothetical protein
MKVKGKHKYFFAISRMWGEERWQDGEIKSMEKKYGRKKECR